MNPSYAFPNHVPPLATARLEMRGLQAGDEQDLFDIFSDAETLRYWSHLPYTELAQAEAFIARDLAHLADRSQLRWGIALRDSQRIFGGCSLYRIDMQNQRAEIGYFLNRKDWGHGYMQEALQAMLGYAFDSMGLRRLEADIDPRNTASIVALERQGFEREGYLKERWLVGNELADTVLMGLLRRNWKPTAKNQA
jgi:RimJ/RimL family protein N-acetyltransferase